MTEEFTTLSGWMIPVSRSMEACGIDLSEAMNACHIDTKTLKNQESRIASESFTLLIDHCNKKLNSHHFALSVAEHFHPGTFNVLGYAMMSSNSLKDALLRIAQYKRVVSNTCNLRVHEECDDLIFEMQILRYPDTNRLALSFDLVLAFLGTIITFSKTLTGSGLTANKVYFSYPKPNFCTNFINVFFGCDVEFDAPYSGIFLDRLKAEKELIGSNPLITQTHEKILNELVSRVNKDDLIQQVRSKVYDFLSLGTPSQSKIAAELGMSLRNLQRKLNNQGSSFKDILEDTRKRLSIDYLKQSHLSLGEISYLVGFSNLSNFNRAFKRWTALTPGEFRQHNLKENN